MTGRFSCPPRTTATAPSVKWFENSAAPLAVHYWFQIVRWTADRDLMLGPSEIQKEDPQRTAAKEMTSVFFCSYLLQFPKQTGHTLRCWPLPLKSVGPAPTSAGTDCSVTVPVQVRTHQHGVECPGSRNSQKDLRYSISRKKETKWLTEAAKSQK